LKEVKERNQNSEAGNRPGERPSETC
jgi:hypothetical protein